MSEISGRRIYYLAAVAIVAIVLISAIAVVRTPTTEVAKTKTLQVNGMGTVTAAPDQAVMLLGVRTQAASATGAAADNAAIMSRVIDALVAAGINKDSIRTISYSLTPIFESKPDQTTPPRILGYLAMNTIQVTVTDFSILGKALDEAIMAGSNEVQGLTFTFSSSKLATLQEQAMKLAIQDADTKAKAIASSLGVRIIGPISVSPSYAFQPIYEKMSTAVQETPIQPGTLQLSVTVQVAYEFA